MLSARITRQTEPQASIPIERMSLPPEVFQKRRDERLDKLRGMLGNVREMVAQIQEDWEGAENAPHHTRKLLRNDLAHYRTLEHDLCAKIDAINNRTK